MYAIIGGTGVYELNTSLENIEVNTEYGSVEVDFLEIESGEKIYFLSRHGKKHSKPPHLVNYRANIMALNILGVKYIYSTAAVGSMNEKYEPGDLVIIDDFIDFTKSRIMTFYEGKSGVKHVDMSEPYCSNLISIFLKKSMNSNVEIKGSAIYVTTEGPRFETKAEINMYKNFGDVVGMTSVPEVVLAKELGMCYATIGIITNWCTGFKNEIKFHDIENSMNMNKEKLTQLFLEIFKNDNIDQESCHCNNAVMNL
ncbi:MAG: MTAP family purine nucleoside phosphorylase [Clostridiales bacterium]|nr:MTAP family purine nucleoside phosphorylase [Clostridiales bacterium]